MNNYASACGCIRVPARIEHAGSVVLRATTSFPLSTVRQKSTCCLPITLEYFVVVLRKRLSFK